MRQFFYTTVIFLAVSFFSVFAYASDKEELPLISSSTSKIICSIEKEDSMKMKLKELSSHENKLIKKKAKFLLKKGVLGIIGKRNYISVEKWIEVYSSLTAKNLYHQFYQNFQDCNAYQILSPESLGGQFRLRKEEFHDGLKKSNLY